jgi:hypothetical protein
MSMRTTWGAKLIDRLVDAADTIKIEANEMELHGFVDDTFSEYRRRSVVRREPGGSLTCTAPRCGRRYLGFVIFDSLSPETVEVRIDGVTRGVALVDGNNQRERLCTLAQPYDFQGGETVCLQTVEHETVEHEEDESPADACPLREMTPYFSHWEGGGESHRIESIAFFAEPPPQSDLPCEFAHVHAEPLCDAEESDGAAPAASTSVRLTWITTWDARCRIEYWHEGSTPKEIVEERRAANHRVLLSDLRPGARYRYRLTAPNRDGDVVESGPHRFETSPGRPAAGSAGRERVTLTVAGSAAASSCAVPVRSGVPFPRGVLGSSANLRLLGTDGEEIPTQARTLGRWPDGTVKWALLDFQTTGREGPERTCTVEYGSQVTRADCATSLQVHEHPDRVIVDTGRVGITFDRTRFGPFAAITRGGRPYLTGARLVVTGTDGTEYVSTRSQAASVRVEEAGPLCCIVVSAGTHRSSDGDRLFRSIFRVHAFAGLPYVRVEHTFVNDNPDSMFTSIASMVLQIDVASGGIRQIDLRQTHDERAVVGGTARRGRLDGSVTAGDAGVSVVDFWQQYPKSLTTHDGGIDVGICPDLAGGGYDVGGAEERKLYYYLTNGAYRFREGAAKTHTCYVGRDLPPHPAPVAQAPPRWMSESGAFGEVTPAGDGSYPEYERILAEAFDGYLAERERQRDYGMMNFGDCFVGNDTWGNTEYDMGYSFFLQWARTGERRQFESACRAAVHHRDVDTCHASGDPTRVGGVYRHSVGHVGEYYDYDDRSAAAVNIDDQEFKKRSSTGGVPWGRFTVSHTWVDGFLLHHYLTGDRRSAQTARIVADRYAGDHTRNYEFTNCRNNGWHLILVMQMYEATGDRFYLNAAHIIIERTLERQTSDGGWRRMLVYGHCLCDIPRHLGNAGFMVGILLVGMKMYHQATDDRRVAESLIRGAEFLVDALWKGEAFQYTPCPRSPMKPEDMGHIIAAICYACRIGGDGRLAAVLAPAIRRMFEELTGAARILSAQARVAPNILYELQRLTNGDGR